MLGLSTENMLTHVIFKATPGGKYLLLSLPLFLYSKKLKYRDIKYGPRSLSIRLESQGTNPGTVAESVVHPSPLCCSVSLFLAHLGVTSGYSAFLFVSLWSIFDTLTIVMF